MSASLAVADDFGGLGLAIACEELAGGLGEVDEVYIEVIGHHFHLPAEVHRVIVGRYAVAFSGTLWSQNLKIVAEVVARGAAYVAVGGEVHAAYRRCQDGRGAQGADLGHKGAQCGGIGVVGDRAADVDRCGCLCVTDAEVVVAQLPAVHAAVLLIVVCELQQHIVAGLENFLDGRPVGVSIVESLDVHTALAAVDDCDVGAEKRAEVLSPAAGGRGAVGGVVGHGAVAACEERLCTHPCREHERGQCRQQ